eukprot:scaffold51060_cov65-Cyclotella_meneghiniana.AAC.6
MVPPLLDNNGDGSTATQSIYRFPMPSIKPPNTSIFNSGEIKNGMTNTTANTAALPSQRTVAPAARYVCSPITSDVARYFLHRRILLPTFAIPVTLLVIPPAIISLLSTLAYLVSSDTHNLPGVILLSSILLTSTLALVHMGNAAIRSHAPNKKEMEKALLKSRYALPFWSLVLSLMVMRMSLSVFGLAFHSLVQQSNNNHHTEINNTSQGWFGWLLGLFYLNWTWSTTTIKLFLTPMVGWTFISTAVICRYVGPFSPYMRCSSVPLKINPFDTIITKIGKNCTSRERFLDMIANWLDVLAAPSSNSVAGVGKERNKIGDTAIRNMKTSSQPNNDSTRQSDNNFGLRSDGLPAKARYSRPGLFSIMVQVALHGLTGHFFTHAIVLPLLEDGGMIDTSENAVVAVVILLSCIFGSVLEMLSSIQEAEVMFERYSSFRKASLNHVWTKLKRAVLIMACATITSTLLSLVWAGVGVVFIHGHDVPILSPSKSVLIYSAVISSVSTGVLLAIMGIQDEFTRWAFCVPNINPDLLLAKSVKGQNGKNTFLAEDLYIQCILMGDGATAEKVLSPIVAASKGLQEEELHRNEQACLLFANWVKQYSTTKPGSLSDDILRMCLLQSIGGDDGTQEKTIIKRLHLSAATSSPRVQPIIVPLVRSFIAFAGGLGESMTECFRQDRKDGKIIVRSKNSASWMVPSGSLVAGKYAVLGAARLIATNTTIDDRYSTKHLSLLIPCVLQSAFKLRCGIFEYALFEANASGASLSTPDGSGLIKFIEAKYPALMPLITACDDSAKMVIKRLYASGDEKMLLRWKGEMKNWIVDMNSQVSGA